jgi:DNA polymerase I-like protein with 3'-5' exonuclease and polymerase domains
VELDYASQEFAIAAILSGDRNMIEAYRSGDPYLYFAKKAGAVPADGLRKDYGVQRDLFKATTLGLQYGMGAKSLAIKLTADMGRLVTESEAKKLIRLHQKVYKRYWAWLKQIDVKYKVKGFLQIQCGWAMFGDNTSVLSVRNMPTQGGGSSIIREAVKKLDEAKIPCISTLHDACYIQVPEGSVGDDMIEYAKKYLVHAFDEVLNQDTLEIRIDVVEHKADEPWISGKGEAFYHLLKEYLGPKMNREDKIKTLMETVFK